MNKAPNIFSDDFNPSKVQKDIYGQMATSVPNVSQQTKEGYAPPQPKQRTDDELNNLGRDKGVGFDKINEELKTEKVSQKPRGKIIKNDDQKIRKTYALSKEDISEIDRLSKYFKLNLSDTISKLRKIGAQWIDDNAKDLQIQKTNNQNNQLIEVIKNYSELKSEFDALKVALEKSNQANENLKKFSNAICERITEFKKEGRSYIKVDDLPNKFGG